MKSRSFLVLVISTVCILLFTIAFLLVQNRTYKNENRKLLLQNDSIMSVNIEIKDSVDSITSHVFNKSSRTSDNISSQEKQ